MMRGVLLAILLFVTPAAFAATVTRYSFVGATQSFTVAATGVYSISALGGSGGNGLTSSSAVTDGGFGSFVRLTSRLNAGVTYSVVVGGAGLNATLAGSGGGSFANSNGGNATFVGSAVAGQTFNAPIYGIAAGGRAGALGAGGRSGTAAIASNQPILTGGAGGGGFLTYGGNGYRGLGGVSGSAGGVFGGIGNAGGGGGAAAGGGGSSFYNAFSQLVSQNIATSKGEGYVEFTLDEMFDPIPEPASWATMLAGFGLIGSSMRRRRRSVGRNSSAVNQALDLVGIKEAAAAQPHQHSL